MASKKEITLEEFVEKHVPCWDMFRYGLTNRKLYNRIEPYITKDFDYSAKEWLNAWNKWKENEDTYIDSWIAGGKASLMYKILKDLCQQNPSVSLKDPEITEDLFLAPVDEIQYYWNSLSDLLVSTSEGLEESNIVWDTSDYVTFSHIQTLGEEIQSQADQKFSTFINSLRQVKLWYHPIKSDDYCLSFQRLVLRADVEKLRQDLGVNKQDLCEDFEVHSTKKKTKNKSSKKKIQDFLDSKGKTSPLDSFSTVSISNELSLPSYSCTVLLKELLQEKVIKIVDFENNGRPYPTYQSINGSLPSKEIIIEGSEEFMSLDLISVTAYCKMNELEPAFTKMILQEAENLAIKGYYTYKSGCKSGGSCGYFHKFQKTDLDKIVQILKREKLSLPINDPEPEAIEGTILPTDSQECFKPKGLFKKVFSFFGYKLNLNVTVEKKKTVANTGQDLIEF